MKKLRFKYIFLRFYLFIRKRESMNGGGTEEEVDSSLSREPNAGPEMRTQRQMLNHLSHPGMIMSLNAMF